MKLEIFQRCKALLNEKIVELQSEMGKVQESATADTKSSMGDKYETGREMMMQEQNRLGAQLEVLLKQSAILNNIQVEVTTSEAKLGSLVKTDRGYYFLAVPLGIMKLGATNVFVISMNSPIGNLMRGNKVGDTFSFNGVNHSIQSIT